MNLSCQSPWQNDYDIHAYNKCIDVDLFVCDKCFVVNCVSHTGIQVSEQGLQPGVAVQIIVFG